MAKEIIIKDRVRKMDFNKIDDAITKAKGGFSGKTSFGIKIKKLANALILL